MFGLDPDPGPKGLERTFDTKSMTTKRRQNIKILPSFEVMSPGSEFGQKPDPKPSKNHTGLLIRTVYKQPTPFAFNKTATQL